MIAEEYQITRQDTDAFGMSSQEKALLLGKRAALIVKSCQ